MYNPFSMNTEFYQQALAVALKEHADLTNVRTAIDKRLMCLVETIHSLTRLVGTSFNVDLGDVAKEIAVPSDLGLSDLCRQVLKSNGGWMTPIQVRDELIKMRIDVTSIYANALAVIHTTLKRLSDNGEIDMKFDKAGGKIYCWVTNNRVESKVSPTLAPANKGVEFDDDDIPF